MSTTTTTKINSRTRITLRWSTAPRHVGYAAAHETNDLAEKAPDFVGTPRQIEAELARVRRNIGQGTFLGTIMTVKATGESVSNEDLREIIHGYMSKKIVISTHVPPETVERIAQAVAVAGVSRYAWLAQAVAEKLEREAG